MNYSPHFKECNKTLQPILYIYKELNFYNLKLQSKVRFYCSYKNIYAQAADKRIERNTIRFNNQP